MSHDEDTIRGAGSILSELVRYQLAADVPVIATSTATWDSAETSHDAPASRPPAGNALERFDAGRSSAGVLRPREAGT
jgi:hypothetical protein